MVKTGRVTETGKMVSVEAGDCTASAQISIADFRDCGNTLRACDNPEDMLQRIHVRYEKHKVPAYA